MATEHSTEKQTGGLRARIEPPRARARRAHQACQRRARGGAGQELLARPLAARPERADAQDGGQRGSGRRSRRSGGLPRAVRRALEASRSRHARCRCASKMRAHRLDEERAARGGRRRAGSIATVSVPDPLRTTPVTDVLFERLESAADRTRSRRSSTPAEAGALGHRRTPTTAGGWPSRSARTTGSRVLSSAPV